MLIYLIIYKTKFFGKKTRFYANFYQKLTLIALHLPQNKSGKKRNKLFFDKKRITFGIF